MIRTALICVILAGSSGCATAGAGQAVLKNLEGCERSYDGVVSAGIVGAGFSGSVKIHCPPAVPAVPLPG